MHVQCGCDRLKHLPYGLVSTRSCYSCARVQRVPIKAFLNAGNNTLTFRITPAVDAALQRANDYPYPVPHLCAPAAPACAVLMARACVRWTVLHLSDHVVALAVITHLMLSEKQGPLLYVISAVFHEEKLALVCTEQLIMHDTGCIK